MARKRIADTSDTATPGYEWRSHREQGVLVTLPSGNRARIRDVGLDLLIKMERIPNSLSSLVAARLGIVPEEPEQSTDSLQRAKDLLLLAEAVCELSFIEPKIVSEPLSENEISIDDLTFADKMYMLNLLERPARQLANFRAESAGDVELMENSPEHEQAAE